MKKEFFKEEYTRKINNILNNKAGKSILSPSIYDTSWVARITNSKNHKLPMFPNLIKWIIKQQNSDGSWDHYNNYNYFSDKLITTLSCLITLEKWKNCKSLKINLTKYISKSVEFINKNIDNLNSDTYKSVGFELLIPVLYKEALELGLPLEINSSLHQLLSERNYKLKKLDPSIIFKFKTTLLHSLEGLADDNIDWKKLLKFQDSNGSFLTSPSATAFMYIKTRDKKALNYIRNLINTFGFAPVSYPLDIFEINWILEILFKLNLNSIFKKSITKLVQIIQRSWTKYGTSWSTVFDLPDLDDTAVSFYILNKSGIKVSEDVFYNYYKNGNIVCFQGESTGSPSHLFHVLQSLLYINDKSPFVDIVFTNIKKIIQEKGFFDKWHLSKYYVYAMAAYAYFRLEKRSLETILKDIYKSQNTDGGWGENAISNIEETSWVCFIYLVLIENGYKLNQNYIDALHQGINYLLNIDKGSFQIPALWIEKCLYYPKSIVDILYFSVLLKYVLIYKNNKSAN